MAMARLPQTGSAVASLYEWTSEVEKLIEHGARLREAAKKLSEAGLPHDPLHLRIPVAAPNEYVTTLAEVVTVLGLTPLSAEDEQKIRDELGAVIGLAMQELAHSPTGNPDGRLQIRDIQKTLRQTAKRLNRLAAGKLDPRELSAIEQVIYGNQTGFHEEHDTVAAVRLIKALSGTVGEDRAYDMVLDYRGHASEIAAACRKAVDDLAGIHGGEGGQPAIDWFGGFVAVLLFVAARDGIRPTVSFDWRKGESRGRFLDLAVGFEKLLHLSMRSKTKDALAQRLKRSLRRLKR
jgi:hypothetical protein